MSLKVPALKKARLKKYENILPLKPNKFTFLNHHLCHGASTLFCAKIEGPKLVFTCDGVGDFESATVSRFQNGKFNKLISIDSQQSLGFFYMHITQYLGLKPVEDEYKVMGLAAYQNENDSKKVYEKLSPHFKINGKPFWQIKTSEIHLANKLNKLLTGQRFDQIAHSAQKILEEIITNWVVNCIRKYKTANIVCGGGVFANVKVNQKIAILNEVNTAYFMPSPGDESNAIGAAFWAYFNLTKNYPKPIKNLYLGPSFGDSEIDHALKKLASKNYKIEKPKDLNSKIARLIAQGAVVARFTGRMEFGARSLGNRSILARPDDEKVVDFINFAIKNRDFWMPFAPTILREYANKYLILHKADSKFMNVAYYTTQIGQKHLSATIHRSDKTTRPQILDKASNPRYYDLIKKFEKLTGIGAVLNTSFNLHGEPIVCSPEDALKTFSKSQLQYLAIENWLISKR